MNKRGFTLVELLAVIAILAILVVIALPNVLSMFNQAKKDTFLTEAKNIYKEISKKYISENMKGNKLTYISSEDDTKLDMSDGGIQYCILLNDDGSVKKMKVSNGTYVITMENGKKVDDLTTSDVVEGNLDGYTCNVLPVKKLSEDTWQTIIANVKAGKGSKYNVGDTKEVDLGEYGVHTLRIANTSTPRECNTDGFSQTACGFVLEFADIITTRQMNPSGEYNETNYSYGYNVGGWPNTTMRTFVNNNIYNALPTELKNGIIDTTVVSSHGSEDESNFISTDKLYLLSGIEIWGIEGGIKEKDTTYDSNISRQLDYYKNKGITLLSYNGVTKTNGTSASRWWLRSAYSNDDNYFFLVGTGGNSNGHRASYTYGISPVFRIG